MRQAVAALLLILVVSIASADLEGSCVYLLSPLDPIEPGQMYLYVFSLERDLSSSEYVKAIYITFPVGMQPVTYTWGYDEIEPGRPSFNQWSYLETAQWWEQDPEDGGVHAGESIEFWVTVSTWEGLPEGAEGTILWRIVGNQSSEREGLVGVETPVAPASWASIKSLFR